MRIFNSFNSSVPFYMQPVGHARCSIHKFLFSLQVLRSVAAEIAAASREGVEVAVVVGGGNFFRGINAWDGLERATADYMGMLATCMNAICLQVCSAPVQLLLLLLCKARSFVGGVGGLSECWVSHRFAETLSPVRGDRRVGVAR